MFSHKTLSHARLVFFIAVAAVLCSGCFGGCGGGSSSSSTVAPERNAVDVTVVNSGGERLTVSAELAVTPQEQSTGLMNRDSLGENDGMLFVFDTTRTASFWMKNTLIPLDMIFITEDGGIADINRNARPGDLTPYTASAPVKYVLEVNGGWCEEKNVAVGDKVLVPE